MHSSILLASTLAAMAMAVPTPVAKVARSCTTLYPSILQVFAEDQPDTSFINTAVTDGSFLVATEAGQTSRIVQVAGFTDIPANTYGCQLSITFPASAYIDQTSNLALNVTTLGNGDSEAITADNTYAWNDLIGSGSPFDNGTPFSVGLFGTVGPFTPGQTVVVNSESCPTDLNGGGNLAFMFAVASNVQTAESISFTEEQGQGVFLTYGC